MEKVTQESNLVPAGRWVHTSNEWCCAGASRSGLRQLTSGGNKPAPPPLFGSTYRVGELQEGCIELWCPQVHVQS